MRQKKEIDESLYNLPFDQFSRQAHVWSIVEESKTKSQRYKILDVGGYKGVTEQFHRDDNVTIADVQDVENVNNYVKLTGDSLPFDDESFDIVVSFDTYEHIPQKNRKQFVDELYRVSKFGVLLAAPFDDSEKNVSRMEIRLNDFHKKLYKKQHRWLKEHIEYVIPSVRKLEKHLQAKNIPHIQMSSNELKLWSQLQMLLFSINLDQELRGRIDIINRFYNHNLKNIDIQDQNRVYYRRIYLLWKDKLLRDSMVNYMTRLQSNSVDLIKEIELFTSLTETFGIKYRDVVHHRDYLDKEIIKRDETIQELRSNIETMQNETLRQRIMKSLNSRRKIKRK